MRRIVGWSVVVGLLVSTLSLLATPSAQAAGTVPVTVRITRVLNVVAGGYETGARGPHDTGEADFYARVTIDGTQTPLRVADHAHNTPVVDNWPEVTIQVPDTATTVPVKIEVWEHDTCSTAGAFSTACDDIVDLDVGGTGPLDLVYDMAADTWSGDTSSRCIAGGSFPNGYICFEIGDDGDLDGLLDTWERVGLDADGDTVIDLDLPTLGAKPNHKDIFVEYDWLAGSEPMQEANRLVRNAFRLAPQGAGGSLNPDGTLGVTLHIDTGSLTDPRGREDLLGLGTCGDGVDNLGDGKADAADPDCLAGDDLGGGNAVTSNDPICDVGNGGAFYTKAKASNFNRARRLVFHYAVSGPGCDADADGKIDLGGQGEQGGNDLVVFNHGSPEIEATGLMHELGHNLNLGHGGGDGDNCKPNYISVMNYDNSGGIRRFDAASKREFFVDYSPALSATGTRAKAPLGDLVEKHLDETKALDATDTNWIVFVDGKGQKVAQLANRTPDWDGTPPATATDTAVNIDTSGPTGTPKDCTNAVIRDSNQPLKGHDDWAAIVLPFRQYADPQDGPGNPPHTGRDPTTADILTLNQQLAKTDLAVSLVDTPDPATAGTELVYQATVSNDGPNPTTGVKLDITPPAEVNNVRNDGGCTLAATLSCPVGRLLAGETRHVKVTVDVPADMVHANGGPKTLSATATVAQDGTDPDAADNTVTTQTSVVARADLAVGSLQAVTPPDRLLVGRTTPVTLRPMFTNNGPSAPIDATVSLSASAGAGTTVTPASAQVPAAALGMGETRTSDVAFTVGCSQAGMRSVTFTAEITPVNAADADLAPGNNTRTVTVALDCVVPVAFNVKPGSASNKVKAGFGNLPTAVLATAAGQYGLPVTVDATKIDPLSVRFGTTGLTWTGAGGSTERHNKGHITDSYEPDDKTRDGDKDMVLHFGSAGSGLTVGDTTACVQGELVNGSGRVRFFGCDSINIRP